MDSNTTSSTFINIVPDIYCPPGTIYINGSGNSFVNSSVTYYVWKEKFPSLEEHLAEQDKAFMAKVEELILSSPPKLDPSFKKIDGLSKTEKAWLEG